MRPVANGAGELVGKLAERYGLEIPLSDLVLWGTPDALLDKIEPAAARYAR